MPAYSWEDEVAQFLHMDTPGQSEFGEVIAAIGSGVQSRMESFIGRTLGLADYDEYYDGRDRIRLFLRHDPVVSVTSLVVGAISKTVGFPDSALCVIAGQRDSLILVDGTSFPRGLQNVHVVYKAGLDVESPEAQVFISAATLWISQIFKNRDNVGRTSIVRASGQQDNFTDKLPAFVAAALTGLQRAAVPTC